MTPASQPKHFLRASIVALSLVILFIVGLEYYWRSNGYQLSYNDDKMFWTRERKKVYEPADRTTVFTGTSRIKWDIDIETWEKLTGEKAVQLALVGTSPRKILFDLANDEKFAGKLVVDVMEPAFFSLDTMRTEVFAREALAYYHDETPAQRASAAIGQELESKLMFLEEGKFGLTNLLKDINLENRKGVIPVVKPFVKEDVMTTERRQNKFTPFFTSNPAYIKANVDRASKRRALLRGRVLMPKGASIDSLCLAYKTAIDKIHARGGTVIFLRLPSDGPQLENEKKIVPRNKYWDRLLQITNVPGIHFADYPATAGLTCVEASHLGLENAVAYTSFLVQILKTDFGWRFPADKKP